MPGQGRTPENPTIHLGALLFGPWLSRKSLRELVSSLNRQVRKCQRLDLIAVTPGPFGLLIQA